jgi:hydroxyacylglutathione hydrolase
MERFLDVLVLGAWQSNCYLLGDLEVGSCVVVDPGQGGGEAVEAALQRRGVRCEAILLTHGHIDHLWSAPELAEALDVEVRLHADDRWLWDNPAAGFGAPLAMLEQQFGLSWAPPSERLVPYADGDRMSYARLPIQTRHTPGHTPGSSVFLLRDGTDDPLLLSGDLLFAGSVGRTDLPRGSWEQQLASIERVVLPLPDETRVRCGHGPDTTVGRERATNPYLQDLPTGAPPTQGM